MIKIENVIEFVNKVYSYGADGLIIQDIGMIGLVRKYFPNIAVSVSTQMTVHNREGVRLFGNMGCKRIVLARELSLEDIRNITAVKEDTEIEVFAHGALCVCYSGRCLISNYLTNRDANRGACAQPCRWSYALMEKTREGEYFPIDEDETGTYILNSKENHCNPHFLSTRQ